MTMTIRPMQTDEGPVLVDTLRRAFATVAERFGLTMENCPKNVAFYTEQRLAEDLERGMQYYILEDGGQMCGCVALERAKPKTAYLGRLAVLPEHRCKGWGQALVQHLFAEAERIGIKRVEIGIIEEDTKLKDWYGRLGFEPTGTKTFDHLPFIVGFLAKELE
jgi:ribosomal protein S18 acetylase RimI-like enzyme